MNYYAALFILFIGVMSITVPWLLFIIVVIFFFSDWKPFSFSSDSQIETVVTNYGPITTVPKELYREYKSYLRSNTWRELRTQALERDRYTCTRCSSTSHLQVHHIHYDGIHTFDFHLSQLETVCKSCHDKIHSGKLERFQFSL